MKKSILKKILSVALAVLIAAPSLVIAASLTDLSDEMSRLKINELSSHEIMFVTPSGVQYGETVIITFESTFDLGALGTSSVDIDENSGSVCSSGTWTDLTMAASSSAGVNEWGFGTTTDVITLTAPASGTGQITAGRCMRIQLGASAAGGTNYITNATSAGSKAIAYTGTFGDTGTTTVKILDDDQVAVTAEVPQSLTFSISETAIGFGDLSSSQDRYANTSGGSNTEVVGHTMTAGTNASSGYSITVTGTTLTSGSNEIDAIGAVHAATSTGSEQFGIRISDNGAGSGDAVDPYDDAAQYAYAATSTTDVVATASASTADTVYSVRYVANIASNTEAGSYSTALTYVGTANF